MDICFELWSHMILLVSHLLGTVRNICHCLRFVRHDHHFGWYFCNQVTHFCCPLFNISHMIAMKAAVIRCCRWSRSCVISKYTKVFIWPHKKESKELQVWCLGNHFCEHLLPIQWPGDCWFSHSCTAKILDYCMFQYKWDTVEITIFLHFRSGAC